MSSAHRSKILGRVADHLISVPRRHPTRVAIDGITAAGKSTFARELTALVGARGRSAVHLSTDDFHHRAAHRHRNPDPARGYYRDAYDLATFRDLVLDPLGPTGDHRYRRRSHDLSTDELLDAPVETAAQDTLVLVDGSFLQSEPLAGAWDEVIWLDTSVEQAAARGVLRDAMQFGGSDAAEAAFARRYHAAGRLYLDEVAPIDTATIVVGNDDLDKPVLRRIGGRAEQTALLFSYGTLQDPATQAAVFGRTLHGRPDSLPEHRLDRVHIRDHAVITAGGTDWHPIVRRTGQVAHAVPGSVLTVTTTELAAADTYEVADHRRTCVRLASGISAWVYLATDA